jgi:hypothetical protein
VSDPRLAAIDRIYAETIRLHEAARRGSQADLLRVVDLLAALE